jgi:MOSC domain-containing protein YiiM
MNKNSAESMINTKHLTTKELETRLDEIRISPKDKGILEMIVRRPKVNVREVLQQGELDLTEGLIGDNWKKRGSSRTTNGFGHPEMQLNIMNSRAIAVIARERNRWSLAGDQLYIDLDLSDENLPPGSRLEIGSAIVEITPIPHNGCKKFANRFGLDAVKFVNSPIGKQLHLRGVNAKVVQSGTIRTGDIVRKIQF